VLFWIISAVASLGIVGTIVACILVPAVAIPVLKSAVAWVIRCKPCLAAMAIFAAAFGGYLYGSYEAESACRASELSAKLEAQRLDLQAAKEAAEQAAMARDESAARAAESEQKVAEYAEALKRRPANAACTLVPDDFDGVRNDKGRR